MAEDLYKTLGVERNADASTVKKAYRKLAGIFHPDKNPGNKQAEAKFKRVNHAFEVLSDATRRAAYDEFGEDGLRDGFDVNRARQAKAWSQGGGFGGGQGARLEDLFGGAAQGGDVFGDMFGRGGFRRPSPGEDLESEVTIDFRTAVLGSSLELRVAGQALTVKVPKGANTGTKLRLAGKGAPSRTGGPPGDLILTLKVSEHAHYRREGDDLHVDVPLTLSEAYFGTKVRVPTPEGAVTVTVPALTQGGTTLRVRGKGVERAGATPGDLFVRFALRLPTKDLPEAAAHFEALKVHENEDPRKDLAF
jgi:curved DNA-binding protein